MVTEVSPVFSTGVTPQPNTSNVTPGTVVTQRGESTSIIAPFIGTGLGGTSSASVGVLTQDTVVLAGIDAIMSATITPANSVKLLNCFTLSEINANAIAADISGERIPLMNVDFVNQQDFIEVMSTVINTSRETAPEAHGSVVQYFNEQMRKMLNNVLSQTGLLDLLEASNVNSVQVVLDVSGGATDMAGKIGSTEGTTPVRRRLFATQIPLSNYAAYLNEREDATSIGFLPMFSGDKITFVFDVSVSPPANLSKTSSSVGGSNDFFNVTSSSDTYGEQTLLVGIGAPIKRRIAFRLTLGVDELHDGTGIYAPKYAPANLAAKISVETIATAAHVAAAFTNAAAGISTTSFTLQTDISAASIPNPGAAPVYNVYGVVEDISGVANTALLSWELTPTVVEKFTAERTAFFKKEGLTIIVADLSGTAIEKSTATGAAQINLATVTAGLTVTYTQAAKNAAQAAKITDISGALSAKLLAKVASDNAKWLLAFAQDVDGLAVPIHHPEPPARRDTLLTALVDARVKLQESLDSSGNLYDPKLVLAYTNAADALAAKDAAIASVSLYVESELSTFITLTAASTVVSTKQDELAVIQGKAIGQPTSTDEDVTTATTALATANAALMLAMSAYTAAKALRDSASDVYEVASADLALLRRTQYNIFYNATVNANTTAVTAANTAFATAISALATAHGSFKEYIAKKVLYDNVYNYYRPLLSGNVYKNGYFNITPTPTKFYNTSMFATGLYNQIVVLLPAHWVQKRNLMGYSITGAGIPANTTVVSQIYGFDNTNGTVKAIYLNLSNPFIGSAVAAEHAVGVLIAYAAPAALAVSV